MYNLYQLTTQTFTLFPIFLGVLSTICITFAISVIINRNPIISVLFLIGLFISIAIYLIILQISFIGLAYLLVYVGAVSILFLFILMLINIRISELLTVPKNSIPLVFLVTFIFGNLSFAFLPEVQSLYTNTYYKVISLFMSWENCLVEIEHITSIGNIMYSSFGILLLLVSIILLLAMIGAIVINTKQTQEPDRKSLLVDSVHSPIFIYLNKEDKQLISGITMRKIMVILLLATLCWSRQYIMTIDFTLLTYMISYIREIITILGIITSIIWEYFPFLPNHFESNKNYATMGDSTEMPKFDSHILKATFASESTPNTASASNPGNLDDEDDDISKNVEDHIKQARMQNKNRDKNIAMIVKNEETIKELSSEYSRLGGSTIDYQQRERDLTRALDEAPNEEERRDIEDELERTRDTRARNESVRNEIDRLNAENEKSTERIRLLDRYMAVTDQHIKNIKENEGTNTRNNR